MSEKHCPKCGATKSTDQFRKSRQGHYRLCKECQLNSPHAAALTDPVDFQRIRKHLRLSKNDMNDRDLIVEWNDITDYVLPRESERNKPLQIIGINHVLTIEQKETPTDRTQELQKLSDYFSHRGPDYSRRE
jgi:hypothetical protein